MSRYAPNEVLQGWERDERYVVGQHTDASAIDLVCSYDDAAYQIVSVVHGWAKSQPVRDEYGDVRNGFTFHVKAVRGGWRCSLVVVGACDPRTIERYTRCHHPGAGHAITHDMHRPWSATGPPAGWTVTCIDVEAAGVIPWRGGILRWTLLRLHLSRRLPFPVKP